MRIGNHAARGTQHAARSTPRAAHHTHTPTHPHRAFTLIELLVVLAITAILMLILFIPLSRSLDLVQRGQAKVEGQGAVMAAMRRVSRDMANAMEVFDPAPINIWGYGG